MSSAPFVASSSEVAATPSGTGTPWRANSCLPWYSSRSMRAAKHSGPVFPRRCFIMRAAHAIAEEDRVGHVRRLRDADRLGDGDLRGLRQGGRPRRVHDRPRPAHPAVHGDREGDRRRLLRALCRGAAPYGGQALQGDGVAARAVALGLPPGLRAALEGVPRDEPGPREVQEEVRDRVDLQHRRQAARTDPPPPGAGLRPRGHRPAGALLQARPRALHRGRAPHRRQARLGPRGRVVLPRRRAGAEEEGPGGVGQPPQGAARAQPEEAHGGGPEPSRGAQAAGRRLTVLRAVGVHADAVVAVSEVWQTTCTALRAAEETFLIDSPVLPGELEALPSLLAQASFPPAQGLLVTHADWDHLLGRYAFGEASIGCAESTGERLRDEPGAAQRALRAFDAEHYVERPRPLGLGAVQGLPVPGTCELGERELELHPTPGHTADGMAILAPWAELLCDGDYLSPVEIPMLSPGGSLAAYRETLDRLRALVGRVSMVVPGHGTPLRRDRALELLEEDVAYLDALEREAEGAPLPRRRDSSEQKRIHAENAQRLHGRMP